MKDQVEKLKLKVKEQRKEITQLKDTLNSYKWLIEEFRERCIDALGYPEDVEAAIHFKRHADHAAMEA